MGDGIIGRCVQFRVYGNPEGKKAIQFVRRTGFARQPRGDWFNLVHAAAVKAKDGLKAPLDGNIEVVVSYIIKRPKYMTTKKMLGEILCNKKPDIDNLLKGDFDAITHSGLWADDSRVWGVTARKQWSDETHQPGAHFRIMVPDHIDAEQ